MIASNNHPERKSICIGLNWIATLQAVIFILLLKTVPLNAQIILKQQNTPGSDLYADAPYSLLKNQNDGTPNNIPIHLYIHDSNNGLYNNEIAYIDIKVKNASDSAFTHLLTFNNYSNAAFNDLLIHPSIKDTVFGIQDFWEGLPQKSTQHTIIFTKDINIWLPPVPYIDINQPYFYFTFLVPGNYLTGFEDVVDFEVCIGLDWADDEYFYLRVNRSDFSFPKIQNWYRGDAHYHGMFTQDDAENGLPLEATKLAAQLTGLEWITVTDHSCDFDNYGISIKDNWERLAQIIGQLNTEDTSFIFIRGLELSVNNSNNKTIHSLIYPNETNPFALQYFGDGNGDITTTSVNIDMMVDSLRKYNAFAYAAHPFAEKDALPIPVNGGIWNLNDSLIASNGSPHPYEGTIISNNMSLNSDIYDASDSIVIKSNIVGSQIWNCWNTLSSAENPYNPWNVTYQNAIEFSLIPYSQPIHHLYRLYQNLDIYKTILRRGLIEKNNNSDINNWKLFLSGGSDAHGDFNYSNTTFLSFMGLSYDNVTDNAIGKINTLAYCPDGMGTNGSNVLNAMRNGHTVISSGPVLILSISENGQNLAIPGDDTLFTDAVNCTVQLEVFTNNVFGNVNNVALIVGTQAGEETIILPYFQSSFSISLTDLAAQLQNFSIVNNEWFYIRAELETKRMYSYYETQIFKKNTEYFNCLTNPIWLKGTINTKFSNDKFNKNIFNIYPIPADNILNIELTFPESIKTLEILTSAGQRILYFPSVNNIKKTIDISALKTAMYFVRITTEDQVYLSKFIKK